MSVMGCSGLMGKCEQERCISTDYDTDSCLIIIGNGFDLHHGLETSYSSYRDWLLGHDERVVTDFELFDYATEGLDRERSLYSKPSSMEEGDRRWSSLEESLGIEWDDLCNETLEHTYPDLFEDNPGWDDFWVELQVRLEYLKKLTRDRFREWVESIDVSKAKPVLDLPKTSSFITFNYTPTLEHVYGVRLDRILHIHGSVLNKDELLQFGSPDNNPKELQMMLEDKYGMDDLYGATIQQGVTVACDRCADTWKNTEGNYDALNHFLDTLAKINTVIIMGNSFDKVDKPYYSDVLAPRFRDAEWVFYEYDSNEDKQYGIDKFCHELAISNYRMTSYMEFDKGYDQSIDSI